MTGVQTCALPILISVTIMNRGNNCLSWIFRPNDQVTHRFAVDATDLLSDIPTFSVVGLGPKHNYKQQAACQNKATQLSLCNE